MDLSAAQGFVQTLLDRDLSKDVVLDASDLTHLGTLCTQAIMAGARAAQSAGGSLSLSNVSERVAAQLATMGLSADTITEGVQ